MAKRAVKFHLSKWLNSHQDRPHEILDRINQYKPRWQDHQLKHKGKLTVVVKILKGNIEECKRKLDTSVLSSGSENDSEHGDNQEMVQEGDFNAQNFKK